MKLSLLHKGLLLVSIPLCFELVVFSMLLGLQNEMAKEAARINNSRLIGDTVNKLSLVMLRCSQHMDRPDNVLQARRQLLRDFSEMHSSVSKLTELTRDNPELHQTALKCSAELDAAEADIASVEKKVAEGGFDEVTELARDLRRRMNARILNMVDAGIFNLGAASARELDTDNSMQMREHMVFLLKCAVAMSALIAVIGATLFSRNLNSRLQVVVKNAVKLGQRKSLLDPISGNDEIADLDNAVHEAANTIQNLEQSREDFMGMVSHDIRSPLNTIRNSGELMRRSMSDRLDERGDELLSTIESNCDRILRLSQDLLDLQKFDAGMLKIEMARTQLDDLCRNAIDIADSDSQQRGIKIESNLEPVGARVDSGRIEQVLVNLLTNAVKHSPRNGTVSISLQKDEAKQRAKISVTDNGKGVPENLKKAIFNRFQQVDSQDAKRGSGLGLAICKALVELHGGRIGVEDNDPAGCRFWVELPLAVLLILFTTCSSAIAQTSGDIPAHPTISESQSRSANLKGSDNKLKEHRHFTNPSAAAAWTKVQELVEKYFFDKSKLKTWEEVSERRKSEILSSTNEIELAANINEALDELKASHTRFLTENDETYFFLKSVFAEGGSRSPALMSYSGAITGGVDCMGNEVRYVLDQSPAEKAGILPGDKILKVNGHEYVGQLSLKECADQNTTVLIERDGKTFDVHLKPRLTNPYRAYVKATEDSAKIIELGKHKIGYVHFWTGGHSAHDSLESILATKLNKTDGLIFDLRDGYGAAWFNDLDFFYRPASAYPADMRYDRPVVALINGGVRSGKEIMALALKRSGRAKLVGQRTAGAVLAGSLFEIDKHQALYLAIKDVETLGTRLEGKGVAPDIEVILPTKDRGKKDTQFEKALEVLNSELQ